MSRLNMIISIHDLMVKVHFGLILIQIQCYFAITNKGFGFQEINRTFNLLKMAS